MYPKERVILIKGDQTKWYDQVIFIAKKNVPPGKMPVDFVKEAERIIQNYMARGSLTAVVPEPKQAKKELSVAKAPVKKKQKSTSKFDLTVNTILLASCILLGCVLFLSIKG